MAMAIPLAAALSDRIGRRPVYLASAAFLGVIALPAFWLIDIRSSLLIDLVLVLIMSGVGLSCTENEACAPGNSSKKTW